MSSTNGNDEVLETKVMLQAADGGLIMARSRAIHDYLKVDGISPASRNKYETMLEEAEADLEVLDKSNMLKDDEKEYVQLLEIIRANRIANASSQSMKAGTGTTTTCTSTQVVDGAGSSANDKNDKPSPTPLNTRAKPSHALTPNFLKTCGKCGIVNQVF